MASGEFAVETEIQGQVSCLACEQINRSTALFCGRCGRPLTVACTKCGIYSPGHHLFCDACGDPLPIASLPDSDGSHSCPPLSYNREPGLLQPAQNSHTQSSRQAAEFGIDMGHASAPVAMVSALPERLGPPQPLGVTRRRPSHGSRGLLALVPSGRHSRRLPWR